MKEIDFLPEWYKSSRRRQISLRTQYVVLLSLFMVTMLWHVVSFISLSRAKADISQMTPKQSEAKSVSLEFGRLKSELTAMQKKANVIEEISSNIDVPGVLAEMSFLIGEKVVLSKVEFIAEKFADKKQDKTNAGSAVRVAMPGSPAKENSPLGKARFKIVINGVASTSSDIAELICRLEESPYFCLVNLSFSRPTTTGYQSGATMNSEAARNITAVAPAVDNRFIANKLSLSEFEITCDLANYRQGKSATLIGG